MLWWTLRQARSPDASRRAEALAVLARDGRPEARSAVLAALDDREASIRKIAIGAAPGAAGAEAAALLLPRLADDDPWVRAAAVSALAELKSTEAVPKLLEMLRVSNPMLRGAAAAALGRIGERSAIRPLAGAFAVTGDLAMEAALIALDADWRNSREAMGLASQLRAKLNPDVAAPVQTPRARLAPVPAAPDQLERAKAKADARAQKLERQVHRLTSEDASARDAATRALADLKDRAAIGPLVRALADASSGVRRAARVALDALDGRWTAAQECHAQRDYLFSRLAPGGELFWDVLRALEAIDPKWADRKGARAAIAHLAVASTDDGEPGWHPDRTPPGHARRLLEQIDRDWPRSREVVAAVPALIGLLAEAATSAPKVDRISALLDRVEDGWRARATCGECVASLLPVVANADAPNERRLAAVIALGWIGDRAATNALIAALAMGPLKDAAIVALGRCGDPLAVPPLLALPPQEGRTGLELASSLARLKAPEGVAKLLALRLQDEVVDRLEALLVGDCTWVAEVDLQSAACLADFSFNKLTDEWTTEEVRVSFARVRELAGQALARRGG